MIAGRHMACPTAVEMLRFVRMPRSDDTSFPVGMQIQEYTVVSSIEEMMFVYSPTISLAALEIWWIEDMNESI
jgi:hypothetical protein